MNKHTLMSFIKAECANYTSTGMCLGLRANNSRFMNPDTCLISKKKKCEYFVKCVLPLSKDLGCYDSVMSGYQDIDLAIRKDGTRRCECGVELAKGQKVCEKCRKRRKLQAKFT